MFSILIYYNVNWRHTPWLELLISNHTLKSQTSKWWTIEKGFGISRFVIHRFELWDSCIWTPFFCSKNCKWKTSWSSTFLSMVAVYAWVGFDTFYCRIWWRFILKRTRDLLKIFVFFKKKYLKYNLSIEEFFTEITPFNDHSCGLNLIDNEYAVTAAHCVLSPRKGIIVGAHNQSDITEDNLHYVAQVKIHVYEAPYSWWEERKMF